MLRRDIYSRSYYEQVEEAEQASVAAIAIWIRLTLRPIRVVDVGCGPGHLIEALHRGGIDVLGLDYSAAARKFVSQKGLRFKTFDLTTRGVVPSSPWDLAVCCEVAEHLDARHADTFVRNLMSASNIVFMTAAEVGQGGLNHVNEQTIGIGSRNLPALVLPSTGVCRKTQEQPSPGVEWCTTWPMIFQRLEK